MYFLITILYYNIINCYFKSNMLLLKLIFYEFFNNNHMLFEIKYIYISVGRLFRICNYCIRYVVLYTYIIILMIYILVACRRPMSRLFVHTFRLFNIYNLYIDSRSYITYEIFNILSNRWRSITLYQIYYLKFN